MAHADHELSGPDKNKLDCNLQELINGTPLAYLLGSWEFFSLSFSVNKDVLIPRPETEMMVELALDWLKNQEGPLVGVDVGTGTACIPVSLAANHPDVKLTACDISFRALKVAKRNIQYHGMEGRVNLVRCDLLGSLKTRFDLICANLPYIPSDKLAYLPVSRQEPLLALDGGQDGLDLIRRLLIQIPTRFSEKGLAILEIEEEQGQMVLEFSRSIFPYAKAFIQKDYSERDRFLIIKNGE